MSLVQRRKHGPISRRRSLSVEVQMRFEAVLVPGERLIFVNVDFKRILCPSFSRTHRTKKDAAQPTQLYEFPHTCRAAFTTRSSLLHCSSSVSRFPSMVDANPHCGLSARYSRGTYLVASSIRFTT